MTETTSSTAAAESLHTWLYRSGGIILLSLSIITSASAQQVKGTAGSTPSGLAPGAAAGAYRLSDFDTINLYNGNVSFHLPLLAIGGRGASHMQLMLSRDNPKWGVMHTANCSDCDQEFVIATMAKDTGVAPLGPGLLKLIRTGTGSGTSRTSLTRLIFTTSDGTEFELRDKASNGEPKSYAEGGSQGFNRGHIFVSMDGTAATFFSTDATGTTPADIFDSTAGATGAESPIHGYLLLRDGTRYWIQSTTDPSYTPQVKWIRDRNGNLLTFEYDNTSSHNLTKITDSLNRVVNISHSAPITVDDVEYSLTVTITYTGFNGTPRTVRIENSRLSDYALRDDYLGSDEHHGVKTYGQLFPELAPYWDPTPGASGLHSASDYFDPVVPKAIVLPDGRSYQLRYNRYGELARVELPTSGAVEYKYTTGSGVVGTGAGIDKEIYRRVTQRLVKGRRLLTDNVVNEQVTNYSDAEVSGINTNAPTTVVTVDNAAAVEKHYFYGDPVYYRIARTAISYGRWNEGREYRTEVYAPNNLATPLRVMEYVWRNRAPVNWWTQAHELEPPNDPLVAETVTTLADDGATDHLTTKRSSINPQTGMLAYDAYGNQTDTWEYAYGAGAPGALMRHTHIEYLTTNNNQNYVVFDDINDIHIRNLRTKQQVFQVVGGSEVEQARITYEYDVYGGDSNHAALVARSNISGHDPDFSTSYQTRGNLTAIKHWLLPNQPIITYYQFDVAGNVVKTIDPRGYATNVSFTDNFGVPDGAARTSESPLPTELGTQKTYAFATHVTDALGHDAYKQYNYYLGLAVDAEDANGVVSSAYYGGALDRQTKAISDANNLVAKRQTSFTYLDSSHLIRSTSDLNAYGDNKLKSETIYDDLGRTVETRSFEGGANYIRVEQKYDVLGRSSQTSNPYRPYLSETPMWTTTGYDALGRVLSVKTPDNAMMRTIFSGNTVTSIDQAGRDRQSKTDALGRVIEVVEDPGTNGLGLSTLYTYDALDHLLTVGQGDQTRTYLYDSLGRLISATNPENGTITYEFDNNGNLLKKTDERKISPTSQLKVAVSATYDGLNRVKTRSYNDGTQAAAFFYDNDPLPSGAPVAPVFTRGSSVGRLVAVTYGGGSAGDYYGYDKLGRITNSVQQTDGTNYAMSYQYNLAGGMIAETYPTGRTVRTGFDAVGRISSVTGEINGTTKTYASQFGYNSQGALSKLKLGNGLWEHTTFDPKRLQVTEIGLGTSALDSSQLKLTYNYGTTTNNGNAIAQTISAPGLSLTQSLTYDELNRLSTAVEKQGTSVQWRQTFTYDRYGNRRVNESETTDGMVGLNPSSSTATNRISKAGYFYDAVGNMTGDESGHTYQYDGECRLVSFDVGAATYVYDGSGKRVKKITGAGSLAVAATFVYDAGGRLVSEYGTNTAGSATGTSYVTLDRLGSTRLLTLGVIPRGAQAARARFDYLPFGEQISSSYGNRSQVSGYSAGEMIRQKFTGYERDLETGLDFAQARYYANKQGRFISADSVGGTAANPQTFNRYSYTGNNPLNNIDPSGHMFFGAMLNGSEGHGGEYPDHNDVWPGHFNGEIGRIKQLIYDHQHSPNSEVATLNAPASPSSGPAESGADVSVASSDAIGGAAAAEPAQQSAQQLIDPLTTRLDCNPDFINLMIEAEKIAIRPDNAEHNVEAGFTVSAINANGPYKPYKDTVGDSNTLKVTILPSTIALFHYHHSSLQPNGRDIPTANGNGERKGKNGSPIPYQQPFPVYAFSKGGLTVYDPKTKATYLLRDGTSWRSPQGCLQTTPKILK